MAKKTEIQTTSVSNLPAFMQDVTDFGIDDLKQYIVPPRLKVVQRISGAPFDDLFNPGDVVACPQLVLVSPVIKNDNGKPTDQGEPFHFVPLYFFVEWCLWNPLEMKGSLPSIRARTTDPNSDMVIKSRDSKLWELPCPENPEYKCRYVEHLNFLILLINEHELAGTPMVMSFSRAEHRAGTNFAALIKMRKAPIFGCQFQARAGFRSNNKGNWYGVDVMNPEAVPPFVQDKALFDAYHNIHLELKEAHNNARVVVDYDNETTDTVIDTMKSEY